MKTAILAVAALVGPLVIGDWLKGIPHRTLADGGVVLEVKEFNRNGPRLVTIGNQTISTVTRYDATWKVTNGAKDLIIQSPRGDCWVMVNEDIRQQVDTEVCTTLKRLFDAPMEIANHYRDAGEVYIGWMPEKDMRLLFDCPKMMGAVLRGIQRTLHRDGGIGANTKARNG